MPRRLRTQRVRMMRLNLLAPGLFPQPRQFERYEHVAVLRLPERCVLRNQPGMGISLQRRLIDFEESDTGHEHVVISVALVERNAVTRGVDQGNSAGTLRGVLRLDLEIHVRPDAPYLKVMVVAVRADIFDSVLAKGSMNPNLKACLSQSLDKICAIYSHMIFLTEMYQPILAIYY